jgi:hypothetical protein
LHSYQNDEEINDQNKFFEQAELDRKTFRLKLLLVLNVIFFLGSTLYISSFSNKVVDKSLIAAHSDLTATSSQTAQVSATCKSSDNNGNQINLYFYDMKACKSFTECTQPCQDFVVDPSNPRTLYGAVYADNSNFSPVSYLAVKACPANCLSSYCTSTTMCQTCIIGIFHCHLY